MKLCYQSESCLFHHPARTLHSSLILEQAEPRMRMLRGDLPITIVTDYASPFDLPNLQGMEAIYEQQHQLDPENGFARLSVLKYFM